MKLLMFSLVLLIALSLPVAVSAEVSKEMQLFAKCLTEHKAVMYTAWWCPACRMQLQMLDLSVDKGYMKDEGKIARNFPFTKECAEPVTGYTDSCRTAHNIKYYPTWEFEDGTREEGVQELEFLAEKTGCKNPD